MSTLNYSRDGASPQSTKLLDCGQDISPFDWEIDNPALRWNSWDKAFRDLEIDGLAFQGCRLVEGNYLYAARGDRTNIQLSRSQSVLSEWEVVTPGTIPGYGDTSYSRLSVFFPVYDGIGYWIGKHRRETGEVWYSPQEQTAIATASALVALAQNESFSLPQSPDQLVYRCIWAPGRAFDERGKLISGSTAEALGSLGLTARQVVKQGHDGSPLYFRLFGDARSITPSGEPVEHQFDTSLAEVLHAAAKSVNLLPQKVLQPPEDSY